MKALSWWGKESMTSLPRDFTSERVLAPAAAAARRRRDTHPINLHLCIRVTNITPPRAVCVSQGECSTGAPPAGAPRPASAGGSEGGSVVPTCGLEKRSRPMLPELKSPLGARLRVQDLMTVGVFAVRAHDDLATVSDLMEEHAV